MNVDQNLVETFSVITVEPALIFYYSSYIVLDFINTNFYLQKKCRFNETSEPDLTTPCDDEKSGITFVTSVNYNFRFLLTSLMIVSVILTSSWSDKAGRIRKPFMIIPIVGQIFQITCACFYSYFWTLPVEISVASNILLQIFSGGFVLFIMTCITYITDTSTSDNRTMKTGIIFAIQEICSPVANGISGYLLRWCGFFYSYVVCLTLTCISLVFAVYCIPDSSIPVEKKPPILSIFSLNGPMKSLRIMSSKNLGNKKIIVWTLLIVHCTVWFNFEGQRSVFYLYFRYRFKWDEKLYSLYVMCRLFGITIGTCFCSIVLSKHYKLHDGLIGSFASFCDTMTSVCYVFASETWQLYLIPLMDVFHGAAISIHYSYISKFFGKFEYGHLMSALNIFSLLIPLCHPTFSFIFKHTMDSFPSAFFIIGGMFDFITFILYGFSYYLCKKEE